MKAITLIQPYATLIALKEKGIETRGWFTPHRGRLLIHAGKKIDFEACDIPEIRRALRNHCITDPGALPTGQIIAISTVFDCVRMISGEAGQVKIPGYKLTPKEQAFGDYKPGRFAWVLADIRKLDEGVPAKGSLSLWDYKGVL